MRTIAIIVIATAAAASAINAPVASESDLMARNPTVPNQHK
jgi:hypothetical protein